MRKFVILSLDGGGVRGYLTASILANVEAYLNDRLGGDEPLGRRVDLVTGTSTGGIIALGLGRSRFARETREFYASEIPRIFGLRRRRSILRRLTGAKYDEGGLRAAVDGFLGDATLEQSICDLCIVSVSLQNASPRLYKTGYLSRGAERARERMVEVAMATTAAPTYFAPHKPELSGTLIDGGLCANNPAMVGLVEALQYERERSLRGTPRPSFSGLRGRVLLLSVGTGEQGVPYDAEVLSGAGPLSWIAPVIEITFQSQSRAAHHQAQFLLGPDYHRVNPKLAFPMRLDDGQKIAELDGISSVDQTLARFLEENLDSFRT